MLSASWEIPLSKECLPVMRKPDVGVNVSLCIFMAGKAVRVLILSNGAGSQ
jgi:hypothetical protein